MLNRTNPVEYLAALNDTPPGALLAGIETWTAQVVAALTCTEIDNGQRESLGRMLEGLNGCRENVVNEIEDPFIEDQKIKAQIAIDEAV